MDTKSVFFGDKIGLERIVFFSDAVMAIAITLLVIDLKVPEIASPAVGSRLLPALLELWPRFLGYVLSFAIIGNYWTSHHRLFRHVQRYGYHLIWQNLFFLFFVALLPFSTRLIGLYPGTRLAVAVYSLNILPLGIISFVMLRHVYQGNRLVEASMSSAEIRNQLDFNRRGTAIFLICIALSLLFPAALFGIWLLGFVGRSIGRRLLKTD